MTSHCTYINYQNTNSFSDLIYDYLQGKDSLKKVYQHEPTLDGVKAAIQSRKAFVNNRGLLHEVFSEAYINAQVSAVQQANIELLKDENTFTVCTAHQPNIFTGYLYFIYKTAHIIAISKKLKSVLPEYNFVPVFYMGSEDNDFEELSKFKMNGKTFQWHSDQKGAVGRMKVDKGLLGLVQDVEKELGHLPFGPALMDIIKQAYAKGQDIAGATFSILNALFASEGLLVLQPDHAGLKATIKHIIKDDLLHQSAEKIVGQTNQELENNYKLQVNPRPVNLFYLRDGIRNRIEKRGNVYTVDDTVIKFTETEILQELEENPDRFSPNVILRGIYQETILPNILFVGGGSEVAYWMQLKALFQHYKVPFPVLILRNSFMLMDRLQEHKLNELQLSPADLFKEEIELSNEYVQKLAGKSIDLKAEEEESKKLFQQLKQVAGSIDKTLI
ncbi:MAG: bacillithiol biosynthesis cysteine-adding enzyme BshC, partial [Bacteroidota bacterium]